MKIAYRAQGSGSYTTIGDDTSTALIKEYRPRMIGIAQTTPLFRAAKQAVFARSNRIWQVHFVINDVKATADAALDSIRSLAAAIPDYVDLELIEGAATNYLTPAVFVSFEPGYNGEDTLFGFGFVGTTLTNTPP